MIIDVTKMKIKVIIKMKADTISYHICPYHNRFNAYHSLLGYSSILSDCSDVMLWRPGRLSDEPQPPLKLAAVRLPHELHMPRTAEAGIQELE
jgi:hypothetical protein